MASTGDIDRFAFIVGAPRCGTTSLAGFLKSHPDVCFPLVKEPHFFSQTDLRPVPTSQLRREVDEQYLARFYPRRDGRIMAADCSVSYLYAPEQLEPALRLWPDSRFVISLRDPMEMLPSLHQRLMVLGDETIGSFDEAWAATRDRASGKRIPRSCVEPRWLRYDEAGRFATYLERLFAAVGRERCLVLLFDDLVADPIAQYRRLVDFLALRRLEHGLDLTPKRTSQGVRHAWLQRLLKRPPRRMRKFLAGAHYRSRERKLSGDLADSRAVDLLFSARKRLLDWNRVPAPRRRPSLAVQKEIRARLKPQIRRLESIVGRDLSHWLQLLPDTQIAPEPSGRERARFSPSLSGAD
jgi:hypothetical protein